MPFQKGHKINIGRKYSKERNMKISKSSIGNTNALGFKHSEEAKRKISESHKGKNNPNYGNGEKMRGKNNPFWKGGITSDIQKIRDSDEYKLWRLMVYAKDNYTCQKCDKVGKDLHAHHIENFSNNLKLRFEVLNGITLCKKCHKEFHHIFGIKNNNLNQVLQSIKN